MRFGCMCGCTNGLSNMFTNKGPSTEYSMYLRGFCVEQDMIGVKRGGGGGPKRGELLLALFHI